MARCSFSLVCVSINCTNRGSGFPYLLQCLACSLNCKRIESWVGKPRTYLSGRTVLVWQYWESFEKLAAYSRSQESAHLPAWRRFNAKVRNNGSVGIFHETILLSDATVETVYGNMPTFGLAAVTGAVPAAQRGQSAKSRLGETDTDTPAVDPY